MDNKFGIKVYEFLRSNNYDFSVVRSFIATYEDEHAIHNYIFLERCNN